MSDKLRRRASALAHLATTQDALGVDDVEFAKFLMEEAMTLAPELFDCGEDEDENDQPPSAKH